MWFYIDRGFQYLFSRWRGMWLITRNVFWRDLKTALVARSTNGFYE